jgi:hypothetical protein
VIYKNQTIGIKTARSGHFNEFFNHLFFY